MALVPAGTFMMGSNEGDSDEKPVHRVTISKPFYMSVYEITQKEWREVMGNNPSYFKGDNLPVENVSWYDAIEYCNKRSVKEGLTPAYSGSGNAIQCNFNASGYRLPTEAEWEWAARGGGKDPLEYTYSGSNSADTVAWYGSNSGGSTHSVGTKRANSLGLYDMSGNVYEWCWDWKGSYGNSAVTDPLGAASGSYRVLRGGCWNSDMQYVRSADRGFNTPSDRSYVLGLRVVSAQRTDLAAAAQAPAPAPAPVVVPAAPAVRTAPAGMALVPAGTFMMGSNDGYDDEKPVHRVTISKPFYMSVYEVTQKEWRDVMGTTIAQQWAAAWNSGSPTRGTGDSYPMYCVSWQEAIEYCNWRSVKEGLTPAYSGSGNAIQCNFNASGYRLPTEAEWEWAARGGGKDPREYTYSGSNSADTVAWYFDNSEYSTHSVGTKRANSLGIYDMSGNVWEWCWDWYNSLYYGIAAVTDPLGAELGINRVLRGGSWSNDAQVVRSALRYGSTPKDRYSNLGFRVVRP
ncbi:MAG: SUMF1/EgtB/PvdO family nonheme iron enzyme [Treponema sp.]|jgi:formylglycine-generating enzyme required for sulfatase activity|nr:SUMF1/EgtB/PvdO family nonheme iron enzyme [Treponema sp.]